MARTISPETLTLRDLKEEFQLQMSGDAKFFLEWQRDLPTLSEFDYQRLDRIYAIYRNFEEDSVLAEKLTMTIVSPLLDLADCLLLPFRFTAEDQIQISVKDDKVVYRGKLNLLVLQDQMWLLVIESKRQVLSLSVGITQMLNYMLSHQISQSEINPLYGMVTNGSNFVFLKMMQMDEKPVYAKSKEFLLEERDDRAQILQILKQIGRSIQV